MTSATDDAAIKDLITRLADHMSNDNDEALAQAELEKEAASVPKIEVDTLESGVSVFVRPNGEEYHSRKFGEHNDVMALRKAREAGVAVLFTGPPGSGKTALLEAAFADASYEPPVGSNGLFTVMGSGDTEVSDFVGSYVPISATEFEWRDGPLVLAMETGTPLHVDEIALIDPKVLAVLYSVMDGRGELNITQNPAKGVVHSQPGFYVVAACNPNAPGARMSEALVSRFGIQAQITTDYALCKKLGVPPKVIRAAENLASKMREGEISWAPQHRELMGWKRVAEMLGESIANRNLVAIAPELDRPEVASTLSRAVGEEITELTLS